MQSWNPVCFWSGGEQSAGDARDPGSLRQDLQWHLSISRCRGDASLHSQSDLGQGPGLLRFHCSEDSGSGSLCQHELTVAAFLAGAGERPGFRVVFYRAADQNGGRSQCTAASFPWDWGPVHGSDSEDVYVAYRATSLRPVAATERKQKQQKHKWSQTDRLYGQSILVGSLKGKWKLMLGQFALPVEGPTTIGNEFTSDFVIFLL